MKNYQTNSNRKVVFYGRVYKNAKKKKNCNTSLI